MTVYRVTFTVEVTARDRPAAVNVARSVVRYDPASVTATVEATEDVAP